ncbi:c-type cytochrome [Dinoroseobacter sp. S375]|uniref:c-type cytochrome n=1 Tax=Dinoroseobacter sp. S375 TaxID=3415136 RepID=UPI003C7A4CE9
MRLWIALCCALWPGLAPAGEFYTLKGHGGPIMGVAVSPSGTVATASFDNAVGLWQAREPRWLDGHEAAVKTVAFVDDQTLVSAGDDFAVLLWDLETGTTEELGRHLGKVSDLAVSPDGRVIASASWDGTITLWSRDGAAPRVLSGHDAGVNAVAWIEGGATLLSASIDGTLRAWDVVEGTEKRILLRHGFGINRMVVNEAAGWLAYGSVDGVTRVLDLASGTEIADITLGRRPILALAQSRDGSLLAMGDGEGYISLLNTADWSIGSDFRATTRGPIWALSFSPDGENLLAGGLDEALYSWPTDRPSDAPQMDVSGKKFLNGTETASNGERQFNRKCAICHTLGPDGQRRAGPSLYGLFGREAGALPDYSYSESLKNSDIVWSAETVDKLFDLGPDNYTPGTKMPMQRITKPQDRDDLIAFLQANTTPKGETE